MGKQRTETLMRVLSSLESARALSKRLCQEQQGTTEERACAEVLGCVIQAIDCAEGIKVNLRKTGE